MFSIIKKISFILSSTFTSVLFTICTFLFQKLYAKKYYKNKRLDFLKVNELKKLDLEKPFFILGTGTTINDLSIEEKKHIEKELQVKLESKTKDMAFGLGVVGLMNTQYAIHKGQIYLIEVNPRASRTVPFVSKATGMPLAKVATRVMWGESLRAALDTYNSDLIWEDNGV